MLTSDFCLLALHPPLPLLFRHPHGNLGAIAPAVSAIGRLVDPLAFAPSRPLPRLIVVVLPAAPLFTMPPLPAWFAGREMVLRFMAERLFETPWRLAARTVHRQPGFYCEQLVDGERLEAERASLEAEIANLRARGQVPPEQLRTLERDLASHRAQLSTLSAQNELSAPAKGRSYSCSAGASISRLRIFPVGFRGSSARNSTSRGTL